MSASEKAGDILENVQEVVSGKEEAVDILDNIQPPLTLEDIDEKTRQLAQVLTKNRIGFYALGMGVGALTGYFVARRMLKTKYSKIADKEIAEMREHYRAKGIALEAEAAKGDLDDIVTERGYTPDEPENEKPPMVVRPATVQPYDTPRPRPPVPMTEKRTEAPPEPENKNIFEEAEVTHEWDWHAERRSRSPDIPYVIHVDEKHDMDYQTVTLTYYTVDDVLCDHRDDIIDPDERDNVIGEGNLDRFGHGSGDASIVYIRNDKLELVYEVVKSPNSFAEEVHGFTHYSGSYKNLERMRARERDEQED